MDPCIVCVGWLLSGLYTPAITPYDRNEAKKRQEMVNGKNYVSVSPSIFSFVVFPFGLLL